MCAFPARTKHGVSRICIRLAAPCNSRLTCNRSPAPAHMPFRSWCIRRYLWQIAFYYSHVQAFRKQFQSRRVGKKIKDALDKFKIFYLKRDNDRNMLQPTSAAEFSKRIFPFVRVVLKSYKDLADNLDARLEVLIQREKEQDVVKVQDNGNAATASDKVAKAGLSFHVDLLIWAVMVGDLNFAEALWAQSGSEPHGDPIRLALVATQVRAHPLCGHALLSKHRHMCLMSLCKL